jgi:cell division transport system ATP-binding protein
MLVEFRNVTKAYKGGSVALESINLSVDKGEFAFVIGPSGAGKTTLLKLIYMDERPSASVSRSQTAMLRRQVGVVFQEFRLLPELTAFENIMLPLRAAGKRDADIKKRANSVLYSVGLASKRHQFPMKLSGGEQQRVAIARAMALRPAILLADEPTGNLDPETSEQIFDLLLDINRGGTSVLVATHDLRHAEWLAKRVIRIEQGKIAEDRGQDQCIT